MGHILSEVYGVYGETVTYLGFLFRANPEFYEQWREDDPQQEMICFKIRQRWRLCFLACNWELADSRIFGWLDYLIGGKLKATRWLFRIRRRLRSEGFS